MEKIRRLRRFLTSRGLNPDLLLFILWNCSTNQDFIENYSIIKLIKEIRNTYALSLKDSHEIFKWLETEHYILNITNVSYSLFSHEPPKKADPIQNPLTFVFRNELLEYLKKNPEKEKTWYVWAAKLALFNGIQDFGNFMKGSQVAKLEKALL